MDKALVSIFLMLLYQRLTPSSLLYSNSQKCRYGRETENIRFITVQAKRNGIPDLNPGVLTTLGAERKKLLKLFMELEDKMFCVNLQNTNEY